VHVHVQQLTIKKIPSRVLQKIPLLVQRTFGLLLGFGLQLCVNNLGSLIMSISLTYPHLVGKVL
jgi:hypothetical protein